MYILSNLDCNLGRNIQFWHILSADINIPTAYLQAICLFLHHNMPFCHSLTVAIKYFHSIFSQVIFSFVHVSSFLWPKQICTCNPGQSRTHPLNWLEWNDKQNGESLSVNATDPAEGMLTSLLKSSQFVSKSAIKWQFANWT